MYLPNDRVGRNSDDTCVHFYYYTLSSIEVTLVLFVDGKNAASLDVIHVLFE